ncbi:MAG: YbfB/YjiJ family MFS transporter [Actinomycetota bacterium]
MISERRRQLALVMLAAAVAQSFGRFTWALLLPAVEDELLSSYGAAGTLGTTNVAAYLAGTALVGLISARFLPTTLVRIGLALSSTGLLVLSLANGFGVLFVGQVLTGLGGALIWIPSPGLAATVMPPEKRGVAMGMVSAGIGTGIFVTSQAAALLRWIAGDDSWRLLWAAEAAVGLAALLAVHRWLVDDAEAEGPSDVRFDAVRRVPGWVGLTIAYGAFGLGYSIFINYFVAALEEDAGFSASHASFSYSVLGVAVIAGGLVLGRLSDRRGRRVTLVGAFTVMAAVTLAPVLGVEPFVTLAALCFGLVFAGIPAVIAAAVRDDLDPRSFGAAFGALTLAFGFGQVLGPQLGGSIADATGSFDLAFVVSAAAALLGAIGAALMPRRPAPAGADQPAGSNR